jgi:hypothetical protein
MHPFHSPYRCHDCRARFWVVSRRARWGVTAGGLVVLMVVGAVAGPVAWRHQMLPAATTPAPQSGAAGGRSTDGESINEMIKAQSEFLDRQLQIPRADKPR